MLKTIRHLDVAEGASAGAVRHSGGRRAGSAWIPACAGMTPCGGARAEARPPYSLFATHYSLPQKSLPLSQSPLILTPPSAHQARSEREIGAGGDGWTRSRPFPGPRTGASASGSPTGPGEACRVAAASQSGRGTARQQRHRPRQRQSRGKGNMPGLRNEDPKPCLSGADRKARPSCRPLQTAEPTGPAGPHRTPLPPAPQRTGVSACLAPPQNASFRCNRRPRA